MEKTARDKQSVAYVYKAFISYSHKDEKRARKLHQQLENFRVPKGIAYADKRLRPIFRDRDDLSAGAKLNEVLQKTLRDSENLIVICSPHSAKSKWVNEEVLYFKSLGRDDKIFTVIIDGEPFVSHAAIANPRECLPPAIRFKLATDGSLGTEGAEPLAADLRSQGDGPKLGFLKLISGLISVKLDDLVRRDLATARRKVAAVLVSSFVVISIMSGLTWLATSAQKEAYARKADAENFVEFMLSDFRTELETFGRLDLMESIGDKAVGYYEQFDDSDFTKDDDSNGRRARALHFIGELKYTLGDIDQANAYFERAYAITLEAVRQAPQNSGRVEEHAVSAFLRSKIFRHREVYQDELLYLTEYEEMAVFLNEIQAKSPNYISHMGTAKTNLGRVKLRLGEPKTAKSELETAEELFAQLAENSKDVKNTLNRAENLAWLAESYRALDDDVKAFDFRRIQVSVLRSALERSPQDFRVLEGIIYAEIGLGNAARNLDNFDEAVKSHKYVLAQTNQALHLEPGREKMMRAKIAALYGLMVTSLELTDFEACKSYRQKITILQNEPEVLTLNDNIYWQTNLPNSLAGFDARYEEAVKAANL